MPKKQNPMTPEEQRKLFMREVRKRKRAGDFDPAEADRIMDELVRKAGTDGG